MIPISTLQYPNIIPSKLTVDNLDILGPFIIVESCADEVKKGKIILPATSWKFWYIGRVRKLGLNKIYKFVYKCNKFNEEKKKLEEVINIRHFQCPEVEINDIVLFERQAQIIPLSLSSKLYFVHYDDVAINLGHGEDSLNTVKPG